MDDRPAGWAGRSSGISPPCGSWSSTPSFISSCRSPPRRFGRQFLPVGPRSLWADIKAFITGHLSHADIRKYNTIQKLAYLFAMLDIVVLILSGLVLWKSVQLPWLRVLLGGYELARRIHFFAMAGMVGFALVHVVMALLVPKTIKAMVWGR